jgi:hypothetical protein
VDEMIPPHYLPSSRAKKVTVLVLAAPTLPQRRDRASPKTKISLDLFGTEKCGTRKSCQKKCEIKNSG